MKLVLSYIIALLLVLSAYVSINNAQPPPDGPATTVSLTREHVESLLRVLSDGCRAEMEVALGTSEGMSTPCEAELQNALQDLNIPVERNVGGAEDIYEGYEKPKKNYNSKKKTESSMTLYYILGFFGVILSGIFVYVVFINMSGNNVNISKGASKKLSKKKEEKLRNKGGGGRR